MGHEKTPLAGTEAEASTECNSGAAPLPLPQAWDPGAAMTKRRRHHLTWADQEGRQDPQVLHLATMGDLPLHRLHNCLHAHLLLPPYPSHRLPIRSAT